MKKQMFSAKSGPQPFFLRRSVACAQRYICLMCSRQFVPGHERIFPKGKPLCPHCGRSMYLFRSKERHDTFRCARYPECRTYLRV